MLLSFILGNKHNAPDDVKSLLQQKFVHWTDFCTHSEKYEAFLPRKWLKTAYFCIEDVILLLQDGWGGCYVGATLNS